MTGSRPAAAQDPIEGLVSRAARGDTAAFARLHHEAMTRAAFVITGDLEASIQAAGAAWPVAWTGLRGRRSAGGLASWLCSLAATEAVIPARSDGAPGDAGLAQRAEAAVSDDHTERARAIALLDPDDRALLALHHLAGLSPAELGRLHRRPGPTVAERLGRLAVEVDSPLPASDTAMAEERLRDRLHAYAEVPVRPVDADATARMARAAEAQERTRLVSVAISVVIGAIVTGLPYLVMPFHGR